MRALILFLTLLPGAALAESLPAAPPPQPMTTEVELWYAVAMILSLAAAGWLVRRR